MAKRSFIFAIFLQAICIARVSAQTNVIDASTLTGKFLLGYQGWHACQGDGAAIGKYVHWGHLDNARPSLADTVDDIWPDLSEFVADELFPTDLILGNGQPAKAYSCYKTNTVLRHFKWMRDYGIDGVMVQRFIKDVALDGNFFELRNKNLQNARLGAETYGRVFCVEYDMSNDDPALFVNHLKNDWAYLTGTMQITNSSRYIRHKGKPVVGIWGLGFTGVNATTDDALAIINYFKTNGCTVMGGVPYWWRTLNNDSQTNAAWINVYRAFDIINPWAVGRYSTTNEADSLKMSNLVPDQNYCASNNIDYLPVVYPGYSSHNLNNGTFNGIPRIGGRFYWRQLYNVVSSGCTMMFGAMFDEIDEGTATYKLAPTMNETPVAQTNGQYQFFALNVDGETLPSDWYLRVAGEGSRMLRGQQSPSETLPITPTNSIALTSPNGGEIWTAGSQQTVTWTTTGILQNVNVEFSLDNGGSWSRLISNATNNGAKILTVPYVSSTTCRIKIISTTGSPGAWSGTNFTIQINTNVANFNFHLDPLWNLIPGDPNRSYMTLDTSPTGNTPLQRSIAYNALSNQVVIVSRTGQTTGLTVNVLDATSGADLYALKTTGISGGTIVLLGIVVADDGAIYAANMSAPNTGAASYKIYRWENSSSNTTPVRIFSGEPAGAISSIRWGDTLAVRGSGTNTQLLIDANSTNLCAIFTPTDSTLTNWISTIGFHSYSNLVIGRSLQFGTNNTFWQKKKGGSLQQSGFVLNLNNPRTLTSSSVTNFDTLPGSVGEVALDFSRNLLAAINFTITTGAPDALDLYEISHVANPLLLAKYFFPTNHQPNANFIGQVVITPDKLFAVNGNNGILAFNIAAPYRPLLNIDRSGTNFQILWPTQAVGFVLQRTTNVASGWTNVLSQPVVTNGQNFILETNSGFAKFYRLLR